MKTSINERLKMWLEHEKISQTKFGENFGRARGQVNNWCSGASPVPDYAIVFLISNFPELNPRWLLNGEGEMLNQPQQAYTLEEPISPYSKECKNPECIRQIAELHEKYTAILEKYNQMVVEENKRLKEGGLTGRGESKGGMEKQRSAS